MSAFDALARHRRAARRQRPDQPACPLTKAFVRGGQEAGIPYNADFNGERQEGCGIYQMTQRGARRCSAAVGYLRPVMRGRTSRS